MTPEFEFMPHGHCWYWTPWIIRQFASANLLIAVAYFAIPSVLIGHIIEYWKRNGVQVRIMVVMFANFIVACGLTHVMKVAEIWFPIYRIGLVFDWWCAISSVATFWMLVGFKLK